MIRETKYTLKFANKEKRSLIEQSLVLYKHDLQLYVNAILNGELPYKKFCSKPIVQGTLINQSHWKQILYRNAYQMVSSSMTKVMQRVYKRYARVYAKCKEKNKFTWFTDKRFKELKINYFKRIHININTVSPQLDQRIVNVVSGNSFDWFIEITLPIEQISQKTGKTHYVHVKVPIKSYTYANKFGSWTRKDTVKLSNAHGLTLSFSYEKQEPVKKTSGSTVGIDLGYNKLITTSTGQTFGEHLKPIYNKLSKKLRGSKNYTQALQHKRTEVNRTVNQFVHEQNLYNLVCEDLKELRKSSKMASKELNKQQYFTYAQVLNKLGSMAEVEGFHLTKVNPAYTSQTCSVCGEINKESRKGEIYLCISCKMEMDADVNAAINILHRGVYSPSTTQESVYSFTQ